MNKSDLMNRKAKTMATKKFNAQKATLTELNRELKRLASRKCRAKDEATKAEAAEQYAKVAAVKAKRFATTKKSYSTYTDAEIAKLDLETTVKAIKSLQSTRCLYPERKPEVLKIEAKYQEHRKELLERAKLEELSKKYN